MSGNWALVLFIALSVFPTATAGTEEDPEASDPAGDADPDLPGSTEADVLAAWFHDATPESIQATLKVVTIEPDTAGTYDIAWHARNRFRDFDDQNQYQVLRAELSSGGALFYHMCSRDGTEYGPCIGDAPVEGEIQNGTPGLITWRFQREGFSFRHGDILDGFQMNAFVRLTPLNNPRASDSSVVSNRTFDVIDFGHPVFEPFEVPSRPPDFDDDTDNATNSTADITAVWVDMDEERVKITASFRAISIRTPPLCPWNVDLDLVDNRAPYPRFSSRLSLPLGQELPHARPHTVFELTKQDPDFETRQVNGSYSILEGTPAYVRWSFARADWPGRTVAQRLQTSLYSNCGNDSQDSAVFLPKSLPAPSFAWIASSLAATLAFIVSRRTKRP